MKIIYWTFISICLLSCSNVSEEKPQEDISEDHTTAHIDEQARSESPVTLETIKIGSVEITNNNSSVLHYRNGDPIPVAWSVEEWKSYNESHEGCAAYVNFDSSSVFGLVYNGFVLTDSRELAPEGFRVTTSHDWELIVDALGKSEDAHLDLKSDFYWLTPGTNKTGFNALPSGYLTNEWAGVGELTYFWTSTQTDDVDDLYHNHFDLLEWRMEPWYDYNSYGLSIRFVKE